jgi:hypothetical protein
MPNWVFNSLVVSGEQAELDRMVAHLNSPFEKHFPEHKWNAETKSYDISNDVQKYSNPIFAFWNICRPSDLEKYYGEEVFKNTNLAPEEFMPEFIRSMSEDEDWYHWNCRNWGTKWDVAKDDKSDYSSTSMEVTDDGSIMYRFETAWSPVPEALTKLSEMFPTLEFDYEYEEEQGWGGKAVIIDGDYTQTEEYDIPMSHADYSRAWFDCSCEDGDNPESAYYEDCPLDTTKYKWNNEDEEWEEISIDIPAQVR